MEWHTPCGSPKCFFMIFEPFFDILRKFEKMSCFSGNSHFTSCKYWCELEILSFWTSMLFWRKQQHLGYRICLRHYMTTISCALGSPDVVQPFIYLEHVSPIPRKLSRHFNVGTCFSKLWIPLNHFSKFWGSCRRWNMCKLRVSWKTWHFFEISQNIEKWSKYYEKTFGRTAKRMSFQQ